MGKKVTIYTQVYNTKPYLEQCITSVLSQTYQNFQYLLVDNGCTDGSSEILEAFAKKDERIQLIKLEKNTRGIVDKIIREYAKGKYCTTIDSDDWWESNSLEQLVTFMEGNDLDIAISGTVTFYENNNSSRILRKLDQPIFLTQGEFAQNYPLLWTFPSTLWGSVMKTELFLSADYDTILRGNYPFGTDTMVMLRYIQYCSRIGIDNSALYHYRIHTKSVSFQYNPRRFDANIACCKEIKEFLENHKAFDADKREWLKLVYLSSTTVTLGLLRDSGLTNDEKLTECARITSDPRTIDALGSNCNERGNWFSTLKQILTSALSSKKLPDVKKISDVLAHICSHCCAVIQQENLGLFARESSLLDAILRDSWDDLVSLLMDFIVQKKYSKQYDLGKTLCALIPETSPLRGMSDTRFFRTYPEICMLILSENYLAALEQMTGLLLEEGNLYSAGDFLNLYISLAAILRQDVAFIFGKLRLGQHYLKLGCLKDCRTIADELTELGLENDELSELYQKLENRK